MLKTKIGFLLVVLGALSACPSEFGGDDSRRDGPRRDHAAARTAIWNPGPADIDLRVQTRAPEPDDIDTNATAPPPLTALAGAAVNTAATKRTLVLFDTTNTWGAIGELYAIGTANLVSHFGSWSAKAITTYACGELATYDATIYVGSTYDEPLPPCFVTDALASSKPLIWMYFNVWRLTNLDQAAFAARFGWHWTAIDYGAFARVEYKGRSLHRYAANLSGIVGTTITDPSRAQVLATARRADGAAVPWAVRSGNFTYIADIPFSYMTEEDRYLIFADLLFDALAPNTAERHRMIVRIEDISPVDDPAQLRAIADYLYAQNIPFGFGVISEYRDPLGWYNGGQSETVRLEHAPDVVAALKYMQAKGGVMIMHGFTHQYQQLLNPYTAVSGDDTEFYRVIENEDYSLTFVGPINDSLNFTSNRLDNAGRNFRRAGLSVPVLFEFPHYAASAGAYRGAAKSFATRWERSLYFNGLLTGAKVSYARIFGQLFPYVVRDVYGTRVLPENLGNIEPEPFYTYPTRLPADIALAAEKNLVVRDGVAGFYFHPFFDLQYLRDTVQRVRALGYTFVDPRSL